MSFLTKGKWKGSTHTKYLREKKHYNAYCSVLYYNIFSILRYAPAWSKYLFVLTHHWLMESLQKHWMSNIKLGLLQSIKHISPKALTFACLMGHGKKVLCWYCSDPAVLLKWWFKLLYISPRLPKQSMWLVEWFFRIYWIINCVVFCSTGLCWV